MEKIQVYKAYDGQLFEHQWQCEEHEKKLSADVLNPYVLAFNAKGEPISWADNDQIPIFAYVHKIPTADEIEGNPALDKAWADYLDSDLECELSGRFGSKPVVGWWLRDPWSEYWHPWEQAQMEYSNLVDTLLDAREKHKLW